MEKELENLPLIFSERFKDEINANDEQKLYNGVKRIVKKYADKNSASSAIDEFVRVIAGGTTLDEIMIIARDEARNPTLISDLVLEDHHA